MGRVVDWEKVAEKMDKQRAELRNKLAAVTARRAVAWEKVRAKLKNAVRATIETNTGVKGDKLPTIHIVLASNKEDFIIKISDRGGGIPHDTVDR